MGEQLHFACGVSVDSLMLRILAAPCLNIPAVRAYTTQNEHFVAGSQGSCNLSRRSCSLHVARRLPGFGPVKGEGQSRRIGSAACEGRCTMFMAGLPWIFSANGMTCLSRWLIRDLFGVRGGGGRVGGCIC